MAKRERTAERLLRQHEAIILEMLRRGRSIYFVADYHGVKVSDVRRFLAARGIPLRRKPDSRANGRRGENVHDETRGRKPPDSITPAEACQLMRRWPRVA